MGSSETYYRITRLSNGLYRLIIGKREWADLTLEEVIEIINEIQ